LADLMPLLSDLHDRLIPTHAAVGSIRVA